MLQNIPKEKILEVLRDGPTVPSKIVKRVGGDTMLVGAILSTMIGSGDAAISTLKIGGSPLYYIPGEEERLEAFIDHFNDKDRRVFNILKEKKILQDSVQDPLTRVSLRAMKDFAKPFEVDSSGKKEMFWRYHLYEKELAQLDADLLLKPAAMNAEKETVQEKPLQHEKIIQHEKLLQHIEQKDKIEQIEPHKAEELHKTAESHTATEYHKIETDESSEDKIIKEDFYDRIKAKAHAMNLDIISKEKIKKSEYTMILKNHDNNEYIYCAAKDKKTINEGDLSTAFVYAHNKKMPCIFLTTGHLTKKAEAMTHKEFKEMRIEQIE